MYNNEEYSTWTFNNFQCEVVWFDQQVHQAFLSGRREGRYVLADLPHNYHHKQFLNNYWMRFLWYRIIKVDVSVISRRRRLRLITLTETLIIPDITKTESNNCFIIHCSEENNNKRIIDEANRKTILTSLPKNLTLLLEIMHCARNLSLLDTIHDHIHVMHRSARSIIKWPMKGQMAIAIVAPEFIDIGPSRTPIFLLDHFFYRLFFV